MASYVNSFAVEFNRLLHERDSESNYVFSPFSLVAALAMSYGGADGTTAQEFEKLLHIESSSEFHEQFSVYMKTIQRVASPENGITLKAVNRLYVMDGLEIKNEFHDFLSKYYDSSVGTFDPADPDDSAQSINHFIEDMTDGCIGDLIHPTAITPLSVLMIVNPVYFKGDWKNHLEKTVIISHPFFLSDDTVIDVDMMASSGLTLAYCYDAKMKAHVLDLPDRSEKFVFTITVPDEIGGINDTVSALSAEHWNDVVSRMERKEIDLFMPIFEIDSNIGKIDALLQQLGLVDAFQTGKANFSKINSQLECASGFIHHARITAYEEDLDYIFPTSAATDIENTCCPGAENILVRVDRPFLLMIRELETTSILFMGVMMRPFDCLDQPHDAISD